VFFRSLIARKCGETSRFQSQFSRFLGFAQLDAPTGSHEQFAQPTFSLLILDLAGFAAAHQDREGCTVRTPEKANKLAVNILKNMQIYIFLFKFKYFYVFKFINEYLY
jgi:hypothetical protein